MAGEARWGHYRLGLISGIFHFYSQGKLCLRAVKKLSDHHNELVGTDHLFCELPGPDDVDVTEEPVKVLCRHRHCGVSGIIVVIGHHSEVFAL